VNTLIGQAEIADTYRVSTAAVTNWRERHPDFPAPVYSYGRTAVWLRNDIHEWAKRHGKGAER
jgi:predicted DNA-binding transcriptional regulator AlpA